MNRNLQDLEKRQIAEKYHKRLVLSHILFVLSLFMVLCTVIGIEKMTDILFKISMGISFGTMIVSFVLKIALSTCPFCSHQLFNPGSRRDNFAVPARCPKCNEKLN